MPSLLTRARRLFVRASVIFTVIVLLLEFTPLEFWYARLLAGAWSDPDGDILIVLSSEELPDDIIGMHSYWRAVYAARAWRDGHFSAVVVSGGFTKGGHNSLAAVIGRFLEAYGVPKDKIFLEQRSISTRENALFTAELIRGWPGKRVLLTSDEHMFRARRTFEAVGIHVFPRPVPDILKRQNYREQRIPDAWGLTIETVKIGWYWMHGWIHLP